MEKFINKFIFTISIVVLVSILAMYCIGAAQYVKKYRERENEIENYEKLREYQLSCIRSDNTEYHANIAYIGNETDLTKAVHEFRIYLLNKSLGTRKDELRNLDILKEILRSHNIIPISIRVDCIGRWDDYEQLKEKL